MDLGPCTRQPAVRHSPTLNVQWGARWFTVDVASNGDGLVLPEGAALLVETADRYGLTGMLGGFGRCARAAGQARSGRVLRDLVVVANGGRCLSDLRTVRDQEPLFGPVAPD